MPRRPPSVPGLPECRQRPGRSKGWRRPERPGVAGPGWRARRPPRRSLPGPSQAPQGQDQDPTRPGRLVRGQASQGDQAVEQGRGLTELTSLQRRHRGGLQAGHIVGAVAKPGLIGVGVRTARHGSTRQVDGPVVQQGASLGQQGTSLGAGQGGFRHVPNPLHLTLLLKDRSAGWRISLRCDEVETHVESVDRSRDLVPETQKNKGVAENVCGKRHQGCAPTKNHANVSSCTRSTYQPSSSTDAPRPRKSMSARRIPR